MKYGKYGMSFGWIISGIAMQIIGYFSPSDMGTYVGMTFVGLGVFGMIMDIRDERKKQHNNTTSL